MLRAVLGRTSLTVMSFQIASDALCVSSVTSSEMAFVSVLICVRCMVTGATDMVMEARDMFCSLVAGNGTEICFAFLVECNSTYLFASQMDA